MKLTLHLDESLIQSARRRSEQTGKSISQMVADYFALIQAADDEATGEMTPRVRALFGVLSNSVVDEQEYRDYHETR